MQNSHLKNSLIAAGIAVFAGVVTLGANVAFGVTNPAQSPATAGLISPTFSGLDVRGEISNTTGDLILQNGNSRAVQIGGPLVPSNLNLNGNLDVRGGNIVSSVNSITNVLNGLSIKDNGTVGTNAPVLSVHADDQSPYLASFYNDAYSKTDAVFDYFGWTSGVFAMGTRLAKDLNLYTNGYSNTRLTIKGDTGNVGIGTTTPSTKLEVNGALKATSLTLTGLGGAGTIIANASGVLSVGAAASSLWTASGNNIYNSNTGNVGIGTTTPNSKLDVSISPLPDGISKIAQFTLKYATANEIPMLAITNINNKNTAGIAFPLSNGGKDGDIAFYNNKYTNSDSFSETMRIKGNGNVGIGTNNPWQGKLVSSSTPVGINFYPSFVATTPGLSTSEKSYYSLESTFGSGTDTTPRRTSDIIAGFNGGTWGKEFLTFNVGYSANSGDMLPGSTPMATKEMMRIQGDGNVGIGTSSPTSNFVVSQQVRGIGKVTTQQDKSLYGTNTQFKNTFKIGDSITVCDGSTLDNGGCFGTSETRTITAIPSDTELTVSVAFTLSKGGLKYTTLSGGDKFVVKGNGNVGIGTTSPSSKLDVNGKITSTGGFGTPTQYTGTGTGSAAVSCSTATEILLSCGGYATAPATLNQINPLFGTLCIVTSPSNVTVNAYARCLDTAK